MPSRSERRRRQRGGAPPGQPFEPILRSRDVIVVATIGGGLIAALLAFLLFSSGGGGDDTQPASPDQQAIEALARDSIEVLPRGEWPSLYESFTPEFQQRCPRPEFEAAGAAGAAEQGDKLHLLRFVRLEDISIAADTATATIVGEITGETEYRIRGAFQRVAGEWKLAPAANTSGCSAFDRVAG
jgi:hypothetical protein